MNVRFEMSFSYIFNWFAISFIEMLSSFDRRSNFSQTFDVSFFIGLSSFVRYFSLANYGHNTLLYTHSVIIFKLYIRDANALIDTPNIVLLEGIVYKMLAQNELNAPAFFSTVPLSSGLLKKSPERYRQAVEEINNYFCGYLNEASHYNGSAWAELYFSYNGQTELEISRFALEMCGRLSYRCGLNHRLRPEKSRSELNGRCECRQCATGKIC